MKRLEKIKKYKIEAILNFINTDSSKNNYPAKRDYGKYLVKMSSLRYKTFKEKGISCKCCGIRGSHFWLEKFPETIQPHFNLYAIDRITGKEILMTKDHIIPSSAGGKDHITNMQTMCFICNSIKGTNSQKDFLERDDLVSEYRRILIKNFR